MLSEAAIEKLVQAATAKKLNVRRDGDTIYIRRGKTSRSIGICIWPDRTAVRTDVDLGVTTVIRTIKQMKKILGIA